MNPQSLLEKLGHHPHEVKVYLAALELGEATVSELAHKTEMPRTTVQEVAEHMQKKGLLTSYLKKLHKYWVAENPERVLVDLKANEEAFENLLPELMAMRRGSVKKVTVKTYSGASEIKRIMDDIIESKHHIAALISLEDWIKFFGQDYMDDYIERRSSHYLKIRVITPRTETAMRLRKNDEEELRHTKFLPPGNDLRRVTNFIYGDKIAIISLNRKEPVGILIDDPDAAYANLLYFENLWQHSSED